MEAPRDLEDAVPDIAGHWGANIAPRKKMALRAYSRDIKDLIYFNKQILDDENASMEKRKRFFSVIIALPCSKKSLMKAYGRISSIIRVTNTDSRKDTPTQTTTAIDVKAQQLYGINKYILYPLDILNIGLPRGLSGKESTSKIGDTGRHGFHPWVEKIPWRRKWQPTPAFLPGESHGQRSLAG